MEYDFLFKIVVVGDPQVGKSAIINRYTEDMFYKNQFMINGKYYFAYFCS